MFIEMTNETRTNVKEILSENKFAFQLLNRARGYNFEKPFYIIKGEGKFTYNSIIKLIKSVVGTDFDVTDYICFMLIKNKRTYRQNSFYGVDIDKNFENLNGDLWSTKREHVLSCNNCISNCYTVKDFEELRKNYTDNYYVLIQHHSDGYVSGEIKVDVTERVKVTKKEFGYTTLKQNNFVSTERSYSKFDIDKSGYIKQDNYSERLRQIKANKNKNEVDNIDETAFIEDTNNKLNTIKNYISTNVLTANAQEISTLYNIMQNYKYALNEMECFMDRYANKKYSTVTKLNNDKSYITNYIKNCFNYIM